MHHSCTNIPPLEYKENLVIDHIIKEGYFHGIQHNFLWENVSIIIQNQFVGFSSSLPRNWTPVGPTAVAGKREEGRLES